MRVMRSVLLAVMAGTIVVGVGGCSGMSRQGQNTAIGAGVGAIGGAVLTGGSTAGTIGGAAVGGIIGHEVTK